MSTQHTLDHDSNVYLTVTLSPTSPAYSNPEVLTSHPSLTHVGSVGEMRDVQLLSVPRNSWNRVQGDVLSMLNGLAGVRRVDVQQPPRTRVKRGDEF